jgi:hypothetical protein
MAKKLYENPGGPTREIEPVEDPVLSAMAAAKTAPPNPQPLFYQRGIKGRDGTGEFVVNARGAVMMPNGDYAKGGDTFNQRDEGLNDAKMRNLIGAFVEANKDRQVRPEMVPNEKSKITNPGPRPETTKAGPSESGSAPASSC